jgi:hypothetical protein
MKLTILAAILAACASTPPPCLDRTVPYRDWPQLEASGAAEWSLDLAGKHGGRVVVLGVQHRDDPADPQFAVIDRAWAALRPTVAFYEGPDRPIAETAAETIAKTGESGYIRWLARRDGIAVRRLEPAPEAELAYVSSRHVREEVFLFYILREVTRLRDRKHVPIAALPQAVDELLAKGRARGMAVFATRAEFEVAYHERIAAPAAWWDVPAWWFSPLPRADETAMNRINRDSSEHRDRHMVEVMAAAAHAGERVFAAMGSNHVPMQAPALRCELER